MKPWQSAGYKGSPRYYDYLNMAIDRFMLVPDVNAPGLRRPWVDIHAAIEQTYDEILDNCHYQSVVGKNNSSIEDSIYHRLVNLAVLAHRAIYELVSNGHSLPREYEVKIAKVLTPNEIGVSHARIFETCANIHSLKNQDYATDLDPLKNFRGCERYGVPAHIGGLTRLSDKMARLDTLGFFSNTAQEASVKDESVVDTLCDLFNYALLIAVLREQGSPVVGGVRNRLARLAVKFLPVTMKV